MKLSLDVIGYGGYFTAPGEKLSLEDAIKRAAKFGYDATCVYAHRPLGFPLDLDSERRKRIVDLYKELDLEMGAVVCCTNFMEGDHVLVYQQEKEIPYVKECIKMAKDLGAGIVRVLSAFLGYFQNTYANTGYGFPAFASRSRRVSRAEDWLEAWNDVKNGLTEVAEYARDMGIVIALQTHPEILGNNKETLEMIEEVNIPCLKVGLDLPLLESQDHEFIKNTVRTMKDHIVYSHTISLAKNETIGGAPYSWEEVTPVYIASTVEDLWADPRGEYLSGFHAARVYNLYNPIALDPEPPEINSPLKKTRIGYHIRSGRHDITIYDWEQYLDFADIHLLK